MASVPSISIIMPVFNGRLYVAEAIESVQAQTCGDFELLVVDDGSTDGTHEILQAVRDPRVRLLFQPHNQGIASARNRALAEIRGEFCAFLNHDDAAHPERFAQQVEFLRTNPAVGAVGAQVDYVNSEGKLIAHQALPLAPLAIRWMGLLECPLRQSALMVRHAVLQRQGLRYDPEFVCYSDYEFISRLVRCTPAANLPATLLRYRQHATNISRVRRELLIANGVRIAVAAIRAELPEFAITADEVAEIRALLLGHVPAGAPPPGLKRMKAVLERYLDLFEAFTEKHHAHPELESLRTAFAAREAAAASELVYV